MMKANQSCIYQQELAQPSPSLIHMSSMSQYKKPSTFPCMNPCVSGFSISALPELRIVQSNGGDHEVSPCLSSFEKISLPNPDPYLKKIHPSFTHQFGMNPTPNQLTGCTPKSFMIFDKSRDQTQMFFSPLIPTPVNHFNYTLNVPIARQLFAKPVNQNVSNEKYILSEGTDVREDTEEINALLYSDDGDEDDDDGEYDDDDDDDGEDDEVTSTGQSPFTLKRDIDSREEVEDNSEDLGAYDDGSMKRRKLVDGGYQKSFVQTALNSVEVGKSCNQVNDAESCCVSPGARTKKTRDKDTSSFKNKRDHIRERLKILESIIPCSNHKDPLLNIDEAINHLTILKNKAKALGVW